MTAGFYALEGASFVIENLADQLSKKGVAVTIGALAFRRIPPNGVYNVSTLPIHNVSELRRRLDDFDIVHNHHPIMNYLNLVSRRHFVYHYHGAPDFGRGYLFVFSMLFSVKVMSYAFDAVIAVSESGSLELKRLFGFNNVHVIYNGVNTNRFKAGLDERFREGAPQFLFVGNLYEHKRVDELILGMKGLVKAYPKAHLQIVGGGYMYESLKRLVTKLRLEDHVDLVGRVHDLELPYYYGSCDVYVTASRYETFGLPLLEAMACGKPVVASSIPPHVELLTNSKGGTIYAEGDIENLRKKMMKTYEESDRYRSNALHFAKEHDWSVVADQVMKVYRRLS